MTIRDGYARDSVLFEVRKALRQLLWPCRPAARTRKGWPLGRAVRERELEVEISRVAAVLEVSGLNLFERASFAEGDNWRPLTRSTADGTQTPAAYRLAAARTALA